MNTAAVLAIALALASVAGIAVDAYYARRSRRLMIALAALAVAVAACFTIAVSAGNVT